MVKHLAHAATDVEQQEEVEWLRVAAKVFDRTRDILIEHFEVVFGEIADDAAAVDDLRIDTNDGDTGGERSGLGGSGLLGVSGGEGQY